MSRILKIKYSKLFNWGGVLLLIIFTFLICFANGFDIQLKKVYPKIITPYFGNQENNIVFFVFSDPAYESCRLKIYNLAGHKMREIPDMERQPWKYGNLDEYYFNWDGRDSSGMIAPQGIYIYAFETSRKTFSGSIIVAR